MTYQGDDGVYALASKERRDDTQNCCDAAIARLAAYENMHEVLETQYQQASEKLEVFKAQGKLKTASAQQLLAQKLTYSSMLNLIKLYEESDSAEGV